MKRLLLAITALVLLSACGENAAPGNTNRPANTAANANAANTSSAAADPAAALAEIKALMATAEAGLAKNDADALEKVYADNYMLINIDGSVQNRAERLAALRSGGVKYESFVYSEPNIRVNPEGTGAIVITRLDMKGTSKGKRIDGAYRVTQVYAKSKDGWRQVGGQATRIEGDPAAKADDRKPETNSANK